MEEPKSKAKRGAKPAVPMQEDKITSLPLSELHDFPNHPFKVRDDEAMQETAESIRQYGVLVPAIVRPREDGGYGRRLCKRASVYLSLCGWREYDFPDHRAVHHGYWF